MSATLVLKDGQRLEGTSFGAKVNRPGEVVFNTGMGESASAEAFTPLDATRLHLLMEWVVDSSILSRFGPRRGRGRVGGVSMITRAGRLPRGPDRTPRIPGPDPGPDLPAGRQLWSPLHGHEGQVVLTQREE